MRPTLEPNANPDRAAKATKKGRRMAPFDLGSLTGHFLLRNLTMPNMSMTIFS